MPKAKFPRYTSSEVIRVAGIEINTFEELYAQEVAQEAIYECHRANFYHIFRYTGKRNVHYVEDKKVVLYNDSLLIVNQNVLHKYSRHKCKGNLLLFTASFFGGTQEKVDYLHTCSLLQDSYAVIPTPSERCLAVVDAYFALMRGLHSGEKISREVQTPNDIPIRHAMALRNWLHNMLLEVEREYRVRNASLIAASDDNAYMYQFKALLDKRYQTEKQVSFYAAQLGLSEKKLSSIVYAVHGFSAKEYINEKMLQEAIWLLENTTLNQGEIADKLGFDFTYFVKFFRKHIGTTPAKYRQSVKSKCVL